MTSDVRFERLVEELLLENAPAVAPDELISDVLAATRRTRRWPAWLARIRERPLRVNERVVVGSPALRAGYAAGVAVLAVVVGIGGVIGAASLLAGPSEPAATPTPVATAQPTTISLPVRIDSADFQPPFTFQAPLGWLRADEASDYYRFASPDSGGAIILQPNPIIASDENDCQGLAALDGATTVDGIIGALSSDSRLATSSPRSVTVGQLVGLAIDVELDPAWTGTCSWSDGNPAASILTSPDGSGPLFGLQQSERARIVLVDVGEDVVAIVVEGQDSSRFDSLTTEAMPMIESLRFEP
jgi:hypothetical protein